MASYACNCHHGWRMQADWAYQRHIKEWSTSLVLFVSVTAAWATPSPWSIFVFAMDILIILSSNMLHGFSF